MTEAANKNTKLLKIILIVFALLIAGGYVGFKIFVAKIKSRVEKTDIWQRDLLTQKKIRLTTTQGNSFPSPSPQGDRLAFCHRERLNKLSSNIQILDLKTNQIKSLSNDSELKSDLSWSPEGMDIYYRAMDENQRVDIKRINAQNGIVTNLTNDPEQEFNPAVSPDGKWLAFLQQVNEGEKQLFVMLVAGGEKQQMTERRSLLAQPQGFAWAPDSKQIAVLAGLTITIMDLDGNNVQNLSIVGLPNASNLFYHPVEYNMLFLRARTNALGFGFSVVRVFRNSGVQEPLFPASMLSHYSISRDGRSIFYEE